MRPVVSSSSVLMRLDGPRRQGLKIRVGRERLSMWLTRAGRCACCRGDRRATTASLNRGARVEDLPDPDHPADGAMDAMLHQLLRGTRIHGGGCPAAEFGHQCTHQRFGPRRAFDLNHRPFPGDAHERDRADRHVSDVQRCLADQGENAAHGVGIHDGQRGSAAQP